MKEPNGYNVATPMSTYKAPHIKAGSGKGNIPPVKTPRDTMAVSQMFGGNSGPKPKHTINPSNARPVKARIKHD